MKKLFLSIFLLLQNADAKTAPEFAKDCDDHVSCLQYYILAHPYTYVFFSTTRIPWDILLRCVYMYRDMYIKYISHVLLYTILITNYAVYLLMRAWTARATQIWVWEYKITHAGLNEMREHSRMITMRYLSSYMYGGCIHVSICFLFFAAPLATSAAFGVSQNRGPLAFRIRSKKCELSLCLSSALFRCWENYKFPAFRSRDSRNCTIQQSWGKKKAFFLHYIYFFLFYRRCWIQSHTLRTSWCFSTTDKSAYNYRIGNACIRSHDRPRAFFLHYF